MYKLKNRISSFLLVIFFASIFVPNFTLGLESDVSNVLEDGYQKENISEFKLQKKFEYEGHPVYYYLHEKSGAHLVFEKNNNIDKKFEIAFRTPANNNKGANHIIEHCVLHGSNEYPIDNVFMHLRKLSYSSFLNAATWPDYTCYPVGSMDEDELNSLARVYTSCVFDPKFLTDRSIFEQEGIRYSIDEEGNPEVNGTVFNEVKEDGIWSDLRKCIFPDTQDKNNSAGNSLEIMDLTFEEICETYNKYYHPANCVIIMSGNMDFTRTLKWLSEDYLNKFDKSDFNGVNYLSQYPVKEEKYHFINYYKTATEKNIKEGNIVYVLDNEKMKDLRKSVNIMCKILNDSNSERIKFLKEKGYVKISCNFMEDTFYNPVFMISFYSEDSNLISKEALSECINTLFLKYPVGLEEIDKHTKNSDFMSKALNETKLYDDNISSKDFIMSFTRFNNPISDKYFIISKNNRIYHYNDDTTKESMKNLDEFFINNNKTFLVFNPVNNEELSNKYKIDSKLKEIFKEDNLKFSDNTCSIKERKENSNKSGVDKKNFEKMFKKLSDIQVQKISCPISKETLEGKDCLFSIQDIGKYIKYKINFKVNYLTKEQLKYLILLKEIFLCSEDTLSHTRKELEELISGRISMTYSFKVCVDSENKRNAFVTFNVLTDSDNLEKSFEILKENIFSLKFNNKKVLKDYIYNLISGIKSIPKSILEYQNHTMLQSFNEYSYISSKLPMDEQLDFLEKIYANIDSDDFINNLSLEMNKLVGNLFNKGSLNAFGVCCSEENSSYVKNNIIKFVGLLKDVSVDNSNNIPFTNQTCDKAIFLDKSVSNNYISSIISLGEDGKNIELIPLCKIVTEYFLNPKIREENGAYGANMCADINEGKITMSSWQDPNLKKTLDIFSNIPNFLNKYNMSQEEIDNICKNLIGSYFQSNKLTLSDNQLNSKILSKEDYCQMVNDRIEGIKHISAEKLKLYIPLIQKAIHNQKIIVLSGHLDDEGKNMFDLICEN